MTCFDDAKSGAEIAQANSMLSRLCCNYKRNKDFQREIENFDYSLDCVWISKSIKQLRDVTEEIMQQIPKLEGRHIPSCHSVIKDNDQSINDRSHNYSINSVVPMINIEKRKKFNGKLLDLSSEKINTPDDMNSIMKNPDIQVQIDQNKSPSPFEISMIIADIQNTRKMEKHED